MVLGAVEICLEIETAFDLRIPDSSAEKIHTLGQLYDCLVQETRDRRSRPGDDVPSRTDLCLTTAAFYRIRRELCAKLGLGFRQVGPQIALDDLLPRAGRRRDWAELGCKLDLKLPRLVRPRWVTVMAAAFSLAASLAAASWQLGSPLLPVSLAAIVGATYGLTLPLANRIPRSSTTIGGLCSSLLALNYRRMLTQFQCVRPSDVFQRVKLILVEQLDVHPALVTRDASLVNDLGLDRAGQHRSDGRR